jgi:hypothetical protein
VKSRISGQLNWIMEVVSSSFLGVVVVCEGGRDELLLLCGEGESESERAGRTRAASFLATRFALNNQKLN